MVLQRPVKRKPVLHQLHHFSYDSIRRKRRRASGPAMLLFGIPLNQYALQSIISLMKRTCAQSVAISARGEDTMQPRDLLPDRFGSLCVLRHLLRGNSWSFALRGSLLQLNGSMREIFAWSVK